MRFFTENARQSLVAAAHDLVKDGNVTDRELAALEALLAVFDQQEEERQEEGRF
jgi:ATP-dependent protease HslVU (ClpYQ) peptidase subunit